MPQPPSVESLIELYPSLHRPRYSQSLGWASTRSVVLRACSLAMIGSLIGEKAPFELDARIIGARLAASLGVPHLGRHLLEECEPASMAHRESLAAAGTLLHEVTTLPLEAWFPGSAAIAKAVIDALDPTETWVGIGPSCSLIALYGPPQFRFAVNVMSAEHLRSWLGADLPTDFVIAEPQLDPTLLMQLVGSYAAVGFRRLLLVTPLATPAPLPGYRVHTFAIEVSSAYPQYLGDASLLQFTELPTSYAQGAPVTLHVHSWSAQ